MKMATILHVGRERLDKSSRQDSDEITADTTNSHSRSSTMATPTSQYRKGAALSEELASELSSSPRAAKAEDESFRIGGGSQDPETVPASTVAPVTKKWDTVDSVSHVQQVEPCDSPGEKKLSHTPPTYHQLIPPGQGLFIPLKSDSRLQEVVVRDPLPSTTAVQSEANVNTDSSLDPLSEYADISVLDQVYDSEDDNIGKSEQGEHDAVSYTPPSSLHDTAKEGTQYQTLSKAVNIRPLGTQDDIDIHPSTAASSCMSQQSAESTSFSNTPPFHLPRRGAARGRGPRMVSYSAIGSLDKISGLDNISDSYKQLFTSKTSRREFGGPVADVPILQVSKNDEVVAVKQQNEPIKGTPPSGMQHHAETERQSTEGAPRRLGSLQSNSSTGTVSSPKKETAKRPAKPPPSVLIGGKVGDKTRKKVKKKVTIDKTVEEFIPSCAAYTPLLKKKKFEYKPAEMRTPVQKMSSTMGTLARPNFRDALKRVAMILRQHILKIEQRFENPDRRNVLFDPSMKDLFFETNFLSARYRCTMVRVPMARPSMVYALRKIETEFTIPTEEEIYEFGHQLFKSVQLSSECSIVCLIYVERLMEIAKVPLLACTWRPIFMCGLLLASKVWQDLASWNIEFAGVYPQYSLDSINRLELQFLRMVKWDLYISSSLYAKYYFALRSLVEKKDFRQRYNRMVGGVGSVDASEAKKIQERTELLREEAISQLSRSM